MFPNQDIKKKKKNIHCCIQIRKKVSFAVAAQAEPPEGPTEVQLCSFTLDKTAQRLHLKAQRWDAISPFIAQSWSFHKT